MAKKEEKSENKSNEGKSLEKVEQISNNKEGVTKESSRDLRNNDKTDDEKSVEDLQSKKDDKEDEKPIISKKKIEEKQEKQTKYIMIIMAALIVGIFMFAWAVSESRKFEYMGLYWQKEKLGDEFVYSTMISNQNTRGVVGEFKFIFRNDPRKLKVPLEDELRVIRNLPIYISFNMSSEEKCDAGPLISFGYFMSKTGNDLKTAIADENNRVKGNQDPVIDCYNKPFHTIFILTNSEESKIERNDNKNCYVLNVGNCEIDKVLETLELKMLEKWHIG